MAADGEPHQGKRDHLAHHQPDDVAAGRAQSHANADFACAPFHHVSHHAIQAQRCEQRGQQAEGARKRRQ